MEFQFRVLKITLSLLQKKSNIFLCSDNLSDNLTRKTFQGPGFALDLPISCYLTSQLSVVFLDWTIGQLASILFLLLLKKQGYEYVLF